MIQNDCEMQKRYITKHYKFPRISEKKIKNPSRITIKKKCKTRKIKPLHGNNSDIESYPVLRYVDHLQIGSSVDHFGSASSAWGREDKTDILMKKNRSGGSRRGKRKTRKRENESNSNDQPADRRPIEHCPRNIVVGGTYGAPFGHPHTRALGIFKISRDSYLCVKDDDDDNNILIDNYFNIIF